MRKYAAAALGAAMLFCCTAVGHATDVYPPGPGGTCPDTLKIFNLQNPIATCHPATLDTVLGIAGIVTGMDQKASAYGFYIQNRGSSSYAGIDIFTGATNHGSSGPIGVPGFNLTLGDSVVVYGTMQNFQGEVEIEGPDVSQSSDDILIRKISSANSLPAFITGTTNTFRYLDTNTPMAQYAGMLVKISSPMRVARASQTGGMPFNSFILVNQTGSATDSVLIEGNTLTTFTPPAVGTTVSSVQGIVNHRTTGGSSWRIQLRDGNDINVATPPNLADGYVIQDNIAPNNREMVRVLFDRNVTQASAENSGNYSLSSLGTVVSATQISGTDVRLLIENGLGDGDPEGVTVVGVVSSASGLAMTSPQSRSFVNGVIEPSVVQAPDPAYLAASPCVDRSRFAGTGSAPGSLNVSIEGVGVGEFGSLYYLDGVSGGLRNGVSVFGPTQPITMGHKYLVVGRVQEFGSGPANGAETEVVSTVYIVDEGVATAPTPILVGNGGIAFHALSDTTCDTSPSPQVFAITTAEDLEGCVARLPQVMIAEGGRTAGQSFFIAGPYKTFTDTALVVNNSSSYTFDPDSADIVQVTGVVGSNSLSSQRFRIQPRSDADIIKVGHTTSVIDDAPKAISFAVSPNPASTARVTFALPQAADVEVGIYDVFGRRIAVLAKGRMEPGTYSRDWTGLDSRGRLANSGMYFYKLRVNNEVRTIRGIRLD